MRGGGLELLLRVVLGAVCVFHFVCRVVISTIPALMVLEGVKLVVITNSSHSVAVFIQVISAGSNSELVHQFRFPQVSF